MTVHKFYKAQGIGDHTVESVSIILEEEFPDLPSLEESNVLHSQSAERMAILLCKTLPGGTLDRLIAELLRRKATSFVVPLFNK